MSIGWLEMGCGHIKGYILINEEGKAVGRIQPQALNDETSSFYAFVDESKELKFGFVSPPDIHEVQRIVETHYKHPLDVAIPAYENPPITTIGLIKVGANLQEPNDSDRFVLDLR